MTPAHGRTGSVHQGGGFTLLEILIAIAIFAMLATIVYSSFNAAVSRTGAIKEGQAAYEMGANCLRRICADLTGLYVEPYPLYQPPDYDDPKDPYAFAGGIAYPGAESFSRLSFASTEHLPISGGPAENGLRPGGLARIRYHVEPGPNPDAGFVLRRGDRPFPYEEPPYGDDPENDPILCTHVSELEFTFYDAGGEAHESWNSDEQTVKYATPRAVGIYLKIKTEQGEYPFSTRIALPVYRDALERVEK